MFRNKLNIVSLLIVILTLCPGKANTQKNPEAEAHISKMLRKQVPYEVNLLNCTFKINNVNVYPPGKLSLMFANYLINNDLVKNKIVVDAGAGCFALGIIAAKSEAKLAIGIDVTKEAIECARENIVNNAVESNALVIQSNGLEPLMPEYNSKVDLSLSGAPWDTLSAAEFNLLSDERKVLSRSFYDVGDQLIVDILSRGPSLLSSQGRIFITASKRTISRIQKLCDLYKTKFQIVKQEDLHGDGNMHYIVEIKPK